MFWLGRTSLEDLTHTKAAFEAQSKTGRNISKRVAAINGGAFPVSFSRASLHGRFVPLSAPPWPPVPASGWPMIPGSHRGRPEPFCSIDLAAVLAAFFVGGFASSAFPLWRVRPQNQLTALNP